MSIIKSSLALVVVGLLSTSALASSGTQDTSFLKKEKQHHHESKEEIKEEKMMKEYFVSLEGSYNFTHYEPKFSDTGRSTKNFHDTGSLGLGIGKAINENVRVGLGLSYVFPASYNFTSGSDTYHSEVKTTRILVNGVYDFGSVTEMKVSPYVMAGIGAAANKYSTTVNRSSGNIVNHSTDWKFAYQVGAGIAYKLPVNDIKVSLGYAFSDNGDAHKIAGVKTERLQSNDIVLGVHVPF